MNVLQFVIVIFMLMFLISSLKSAPLLISMDSKLSVNRPVSQVTIHRVKRSAFGIVKSGGKAVYKGLKWGWTGLKYGFKGLQGTGKIIETVGVFSDDAVKTVDNFNNVANIFKNGRRRVGPYPNDDYAMPPQRDILNQLQQMENNRKPEEIVENKTEEPFHKRYFMEILCAVLFLNMLIFLWFVRAGNSAERSQTNLPPSNQFQSEKQADQIKRKRKKSKKSRSRRKRS